MTTPRKQEVTLHQVADRHRDLHGRAFSETRRSAVPEDAVVKAVGLLGFPDVQPGSYSITVGWPYD